MARAAPAAPPAGPGVYYLDWLDRHSREAEPEPSEFKFISYFFARGTATNQLADPAGLRGVSIGPIGIGENTGSATRVGRQTEAYYIEQRWIPVLSYSPNFADGLATVRAQFEIDFMWGQSANTVQPNQGGGFNADQVNIQTKNVNIAIYPFKNPKKLAIVVGTQPLYDSIYDPATTSLFDIVKTGYKLSFFGTDGTGLAAYGNLGGLWKASIVPISVAQPDKATQNDARFAFVWIGTLDYAYEIMPGTVVGASFWHLRDDTKGAAYVYEGLVKTGPTSTGLYPYTGVAHLNIEQAVGGVEYLGLNFHHNINFKTSPFGASGFLMTNFGKYESKRPDTMLQPEVSIFGGAANLELMYNYGRTIGDLITLEGMFTTGESDLLGKSYGGVLTLNHYGLPGAVWFDHKTLILFPFTSTVSNYTGAITDISNQGFGLMSGIFAAAYDLIPDTLNFKVGSAYAQTAVRPPPQKVAGTDFQVPRGRTVGLELNAELKWQIRYLMTLGLHGAVMSAGNFYDGNPQITKNPWAAFTTFTWYGF